MADEGDRYQERDTRFNTTDYRIDGVTDAMVKSTRQTTAMIRAFSEAQRAILRAKEANPMLGDRIIETALQGLSQSFSIEHLMDND